MVTIEDVGAGKPDPAGYLLALEQLGAGLDPADVTAFEDTEAGVAAAKAAGMYCIAVRNPHALMRQDLDAADLVVDSFEQLLTSSSPSAR